MNNEFKNIVIVVVIVILFPIMWAVYTKGDVDKAAAKANENTGKAFSVLIEDAANNMVIDFILKPVADFIDYVTR